MQKPEVREQTEYLIGDVAQMVGLSRDALRFYEKKGVISARKKENGYRYYSEDDIYKLMCILYQRKMNTSLKEIEGFMSGRRTIESRRKRLRERMAEEEAAVRTHQQVITRLKLVETDINRVEECLNRYSLRRFPCAYILGDCDNLQEGLKEWFRLSSDIEGLDMTYFYNMLTYTGKGLVEQGTRLLLYKGLEPEIGEGFDAARYPMTEDKPCLYTVLESRTPLPGFDMVQKMAQWGHRQGVETEGLVYANNMTSFFAEEKVVYCLELYMPVKRVLSRI